METAERAVVNEEDRNSQRHSRARSKFRNSYSIIKFIEKNFNREEVVSSVRCFQKVLIHEKREKGNGKFDSETSLGRK